MPPILPKMAVVNGDSEATDAEKFFHTRIPITLAMGVRVVQADPHGFAVEAPVALNSNHMQTGFGGSINAVATLAGYGCLWMRLRDRASCVVIQESSIRFLQPVTDTIRAVCRVDAAELDAFVDEVRSRGTARIQLAVEVAEKGGIAAEFHGTFVALKQAAAQPARLE